MSAPQTAVRTSRSVEVPVRTVDSDVHPAFRAREEMLEYLPEPWRSREAQRFAYGGSQNALIYPPGGARADATRLDAVTPAGGPPGSDPEFLRRELLERGKVDMAILIPLGARPRANPEHEAAGCRAVNRWLDEVWLTRNNQDGRFRGAISVCMGDVDLAVEEIEHWAGHPHFVEVYVRPPAPAGQPQFDRVYEAATRHGLAIAFHPIRNPGLGLLTPAGFSSYYLEIHPAWSLVVAPHLVSLLLGGVLKKFPRLRIAIKEFGVGWVAPFLWRLDRMWAAQRREVPWVERPPSEYFREHIRLTTQPWEEAPQGRQELMLDAVGAGQTLMFSTDYPHHDADEPSWLEPHLPAAHRDAIMAGTAIDFYSLPRFLNLPEGAER